MATKSNSQRVKELRAKRQEESKKNSSSTSVLRNSDKVKKLGYERSIGFNTLQSDITSLSKSVDSAYKGWQTNETMQNTLSSLQSMYDRLGTYQDYQKKYGGTDLSELQKTYKNVLDEWDDLSKTYGKYKNADAYKKAEKDAKKRAEEYEGMKTADIGVVKKEITSLEEMYKIAKGYNDKVNSTTNSIYDGMGADEYSSIVNKKKKATKERDDYLKSIGYDSIDALEKALGEKKQYKNKAEWIQKGLTLSSVNDENSKNYDKDFEKYSGYVAPKDKFFQFGSAVTDEDIHKIINDEEYRKQYLGNANSSAEAGLGAVGYEYMTNEEKELYNYYYNKYGVEKGKEYLNTILEDLGTRKALADFERYEGKTWSELGFGVSAGLDQFASGMKNLLNTSDEYIPVNSTQQLSGLIREDLTYEHGNWGKVPYDLITTTSNMLPSILTSKVIGTINPVVGANVGATLMGASAAGNAYQEMLNLGYDKGQARTYSTLVGVSEAALERVLGGISSLGGTSGKIAKLVDGIDNGLARFAIRWGGSMVSEGVEESLQEILDPIFQNIAAGYDTGAEVDWSEVVYSGLLGALSGGVLEGVSLAPNSIAESRYNKAMGKNIKANERVGDVFDLANNPEIASAYDTYTRYAKKGITADNISDAKLGRMYSMAKMDAQEVLDSKTSTVEQRDAAQKILDDLGVYSQHNVGTRTDSAQNIDKKAFKDYSEKNIEVEDAEGNTKMVSALDILIEDGLESAEGTDAYRIATELKAKIDNGKKVSAKEIQSLTEANDRAIRAEESSGIATQLIEKGESEEIANLVARKMRGETLTTEEAEKVLGSENALQIIAEIDNADNTTTEILETAKGMDKEKGALFVSLYDGKTEVESYTNAFNLAVAKAENNFGIRELLAHKGVLSNEQIGKIYSEVVSKADQNTRLKFQKLSEKTANLKAYKGIIKDSVIDYNNTSAEGKVNWKDINPERRKEITFVKGLAQATGMNLEIIKDGKERKMNGSYSISGNTITIDIFAEGRLNANELIDAIIPTMSHELTHWMEQKSPVLFRKICDVVFPTLERIDSLTESERIAKEIKRLESKGILNETDSESKKIKVARSEIVARACEDMLSRSKVGREMFNSLTEKEQKTLIDKIKDIIENIKNWINDALGLYESTSYEAQIMRIFDAEMDKLSALWDEMLKESVEVNQALEKSGAFEHKKSTTEGDVLYAFTDYASGDSKYIIDAIKRNMDLISAEKKFSVESEEIDESIRKSDYVFNIFKAQGEMAFNQTLGNVELSHSGAKKTVFHGFGEEKLAATKAVKDVIEHGDIVEKTKNYENKGIDRYVIAARGEIDTNDSIVGVIVNSYPNNKNSNAKFYLHEAIIIEKDSPFMTAPQLSVDAMSESVSKDSIRNPEEKVKENIDTELADAGLRIDEDTKSIAPDTLLSERTWTESEYVQNRDVAISAIVKALGVTKEEATRYVDNINSISRLIADDRARLDYDPNIDGTASALKTNKEYKWTVDMSTLCAKRLLFTGTFDAIQKKLPNTVFDSDDIVSLRSMMMQRGYEVACGICYVESTRRELGPITAEFIERYKLAQKNGTPISKINSAGEEVTLQERGTKRNFYAEEGYVPTLAELNTTDIDLVKRDHPEVYAAYLSFMKSRGQAIPKLLETRTEYKGEILKHFNSKSAVKSRNDAGGLRVQSFSDFEVAHLIDMMQIVLDMSRVGLMSQAYTKVPAFADVFGNTGMKINLSLIAKDSGLDKNGNLIFDDVEGMPHKEAFRLRNKYSKNVGTILVGKNDAHIRAALADSRIDYVIPFHKSFWKESLYEALGLTGYDDYTDTQNEKPFDKDRKIKNFQPSEYWDYSKSGEENAKTYLKMCAEDGRIPKFPQFQNCEGYWKLLIDFKMYDNDGVGSPQLTVKPDFSMDEANAIMNNYEGGHRAFPVAQDVVDDFVKKYEGRKDILYSERVTDITEDEYKEMKKHFGVTGNFNVAGYMLRNGSLLDFSGKHWGDTTSRSRQVDHREISEVLPSENNGVDAMVNMISNGNIRLMPEVGGINLAVAPSKNQRVVLRRYIEYMSPKEGIIVDIDMVGGDTIKSFTYNPGTSANTVMRDIDNYFKGGTQSELMRFHTADGDGLLLSERDDTSVYDIIGETERIRKENEKLDADAIKLKNIIGTEEVANRRYLALANYLKKISGSTMDSAKLGNMLKKAYTSMQNANVLSWNDIASQTQAIAESLMNKDLGVSTDYFLNVMNEIRKDKISLSEEQRAMVEKRFGNYGNFHKYVFGRANVTKDGKPLTEVWKNWAKIYPSLFDKNLQGAEQIDALIELVDALKSTSSIMGEYERQEAIRHLSTEIYNQFWNIAADSSTLEEAKTYRAEHKTMMTELRKDYEQRQKSLATHPTGETALKYESLLKKVRETKKKEIALAKKHGREMMDKYKENAERKTRIQSITSNSLNLNEMLLKNSKDKHIPEIMKEPVTALLQAIDFSSKRMLEKGEPTQKDISLSKALGKVKDMMVKATNAHDELVELYGHGLDEDIEIMVDHVDDIMRMVGDNEFVLNRMSLADLQTLDKMVKTIRHAVNKLNKFHTVNHARGIANLSQESVVYLDSLGKANVHDGFVGKAEKMLNWGNALPYYAFKRYGSGGMKVYEALQDGWDKFAFNTKAILDYANESYTSEEVNEWGKDIKTFKILIPATEFELADENYMPQYQEVQLTVPQIMSMYCLNKREQARGHLFKGGIRVADFKTEKGKVVSQTDGIIFTEADVSNILNSLTDRQKAVADKLQRFMNTVSTDWGNEVSMARFGYKAFGEENYFPIQSDKNNLAVNDETEQINSLFKLLNMSFTKNTVEKANNRIVISDMFDVFAQHTSDMAKYNALALPVLDAFKWYNYTEKTEKGEGTFRTSGVKQSIEKAFGKDGQSYFTTFLKDINGQQDVSRDTLGKSFFTNAKIAAVGMNLRVVLLQPTSYARAGAVIDNKYLLKALSHKPKVNKAEEHCGIALWKSMGYYDTNIQRGVEEQIKHADTWKDKATEWSMKGAEVADKLTWGYLWNACELEIRDTRKDLKVGSKEFYEAIGKRLREVIYATQVVDSTMTRSQMMRSTDWRDKMLTSFASEPTLSYNMLQDAYMEYSLDARQMGKSKAIKKNAKRIARVISAYTITNAVAALVESAFDAYREDDDEEMDMIAFIKLYLKNFAFDMSIGNKIPWVKELYSLMQGYSSSRLDTQWAQYLYSAINAKKPSKRIKDSIRLISQLSGIPFYNVYRDTMAALSKLDLFTEEDLNEMFGDFDD